MGALADGAGALKRWVKLPENLAKQEKVKRVCPECGLAIHHPAHRGCNYVKATGRVLVVK